MANTGCHGQAQRGHAPRTRAARFSLRDRFAWAWHPIGFSSYPSIQTRRSTGGVAADLIRFWSERSIAPCTIAGSRIPSRPTHHLVRRYARVDSSTSVASLAYGRVLLNSFAHDAAHVGPAIVSNKLSVRHAGGVRVRANTVKNRYPVSTRSTTSDPLAATGVN